MKVRLNSIPYVGGLDVDLDLPPADFKGTRERADESFASPVHCDLHLEHSGDDVFLSGEVRASIDILCYRCGDAGVHPMQLKLFLTCSPKGGKSVVGRARRNRDKFGGGADLHQESEEGLVFFDRDELNLSEIVREQVLLSLPMRYLCQENCPGIAGR